MSSLCVCSHTALALLMEKRRKAEMHNTVLQVIINRGRIPANHRPEGGGGREMRVVVLISLPWQWIWGVELLKNTEGTCICLLLSSDIIYVSPELSTFKQNERTNGSLIGQKHSSAFPIKR